MGDRRTMWRRRWGSNPHVTDLQFLPQSQRTPSTEALSEGSQQRLASCLGEALETYPDLERVFSAWTKLPELQQAGYRGAVWPEHREPEGCTEKDVGRQFQSGPDHQP